MKPAQSPQSPQPGLELVIPNPKLKLMDQVREVLCVRHYAIRTETSYCDWIRRYIRFHTMQSRQELLPGAAKVEEFLSDLAVSLSPQDKALSAEDCYVSESVATSWQRAA